MNNIFEYKGKFYFIKKQQFEIREKYMERVWYILNNDKLNVVSFEILEKESLIWSNEKNLNCEY